MHGVPGQHRNSPGQRRRRAGRLLWHGWQLLTIESPDPDRYRDLHIAAHEGLPRVGFLDDYGAKLPTQNFEARNAKQLVTKRLGDEFEAYSGLLALHFAKAHFAPDILLGGKQVAGTTPKGFAMGLAGNMVTDTVFKGYFCGGKPNCGDTKSRSLYQHSPRLTLSLARRWGGAKDEFAARAALETFIDKGPWSSGRKPYPPKLHSPATWCFRNMTSRNRVSLST